MVGSLLLALTFFAALGCGLIGGLFFAFSAFVMNALARLPAVQGIAAMQSINVAVINPLFLMTFFGTAALCVLAAVVALIRWGEPGVICVLAGSACYLVGTILITMMFNVPLNNELAAIESNGAGGAALWSRYVTAWTGWNHVRTVAALAAAGLLIVATYLQARGPHP